MTKEETLQVLLFEMHREIEEATAVALKWLGSSQQGTDVAYPPSTSLTADEKHALKKLKLSPAAHSALKKIITYTASAPLFRLFCLMDGIADPESSNLDYWRGVDFVEKPSEPDAEEDMLHDQFFSSFWEYKPG